MLDEASKEIEVLQTLHTLFHHKLLLYNRLESHRAHHRVLKNLVWLPALSFPSGKPYNQYQLYRGCNLFDSSKANQRLLDCHVPYIASEIKNSRLLELLQDARIT